jgi:putative oxidoreductase
VTTVGILSPLVLFPDDLFAGKDHAPTLEGQYVLKDLVLVASGLVVAARELTGRPLPTAPERQASSRASVRTAEAVGIGVGDHRSQADHDSV